MAKRTSNENYIHSCDCSCVNAPRYICSIADAGYSDDEFKSIIEFYVLKAPIMKSDKSDSYGLKNLKEYGWFGNAGMNELERKLLKSSNIPSFCFIRSTTIKDTLENMLLGDANWCVEHPRAVLKQDFTTKVFENGKVEVDTSETRMECLFRHIRNALAHNHTYVFENGNIVLEDVDNQNHTISARILLKKETLLQWIEIIKEKSKTKNSSDSQEKQKTIRSGSDAENAHKEAS